MTQDQLKQAVAQAAVDHIVPHLSDRSIIGVGTGSTANFFIDLLAKHKGFFDGAVASSEATAERLKPRPSSASPTAASWSSSWAPSRCRWKSSRWRAVMSPASW